MTGKNTYIATVVCQETGESHRVTFDELNESARRCAISFNPGKDEVTAKIQAFCAAAMQVLDNERTGVAIAQPQNPNEVAAQNDALRGYATALTNMETGQMFAVKASHAKKNAGV